MKPDDNGPRMGPSDSGDSLVALARGRSPAVPLQALAERILQADPDENLFEYIQTYLLRLSVRCGVSLESLRGQLLELTRLK